MGDNFNLRIAERHETGKILEYIKKLANYEKLLNQVVATEESLEYWIFEKGIGEVLFAEEDGEIIGFALYFFNFSTFEGRAGLYLEDVYIDEDKRHKGYGKKIFKKLAEIALERGCTRFEFVCLDWNEKSIEFYKKLGAKSMDDWTIYRLEVEEMEKLVNSKE